MPNFSDLYPSGGGIKSVQRGVSKPTDRYVSGNLNSTLVVTISPVNPSKATVSLLTAGNAYEMRLRLLSGTQLEVVSANSDSSSALGVNVSWEVIEWN